MTLEEAIIKAQQHFASGEFSECQALCNVVLQAVPRHPEATRLFRALPAQNTYGADFYEWQAEQSYRSAQVMLGMLFSNYRPKSMVDFGAGAGSWLRAARELGVERVLGIEGPWAKSIVAASGLEYRFQNMEERVGLTERFDLAMSVEVAEHLPPERSESFVQDLCGAAGLVVFGAAMPHQGGNGHINERLQSFWIGLFEDNGYLCIDFFRPALWFQPNVDPWYVQNTFLFARKGDSRAGLFSTTPLYDVHHPKLVNPDVLRHFENGWADEM